MPKITRIGHSHGVVIPSTTLAQANLTAGDSVIVAPIQDGVLVVEESSLAGRFVAAMTETMDTYAETYRTLASEELSR
ncbi:MAG: hypothetical protein F4213_13160 [Boseongicola sp. SB0677_bin_26]|nr:hypothetical protein [Boseongicola sp. SB0665_bin_10]MYG26949.1 hypothetical protein [Boseongicola sp. SB0677_bin_26]